MISVLKTQTALDPNSMNRLGAFIDEHTGLQFATLDGVKFWVNPDSVVTSGSWNKVNLICRNGFGRQTFTANPLTITLQGTTGIGGVGKLWAMEQFRPMAGNKDRRMQFTFPARFNRTLWVYVNSFEDSITNQQHMYHFYDIELNEFPSGAVIKQSAIKLASSSGIVINLPPGGS